MCRSSRWLGLYHRYLKEIGRLLIGLARLPLLTVVVVMLPAAAAALKHFLALYAGQVY